MNQRRTGNRMSGKQTPKVNCGTCKWRPINASTCNPPKPARSKTLRLLQGRWQKWEEIFKEWRPGHCVLYAEREVSPLEILTR